MIREDPLDTHIRAALAPWRSDGLLSRAAVDEICRCQAASLPAGMTSRFGFESRLGEPQPTVDFLVRVGAHQEEWQALAHYAASRNSVPWTGISSILGARAGLNNLWLEYDFGAPANKALVPSVFIGPDGLTSGAATEHVAQALGILLACPLTPRMRRTLHAVVDALPKEAKLFQAGVMCSRPSSPLRLCLLGSDFKNREIRDFLTAVHWPADFSQVTELLRTFASLIDHVALDLDIAKDGSVAPKLGIEIYQNQVSASADRMVAFVSRLTQQGLCTPEKASGRLSWNGVTHERLYPELWPRSLVMARVVRGGEEYSTFCRWLHHVKLVYEPGASLTAKAYLAVSHAFLTDSAIREAASLTQQKQVSAAVSP